MSNYSALIATINANIKANNNHEITGAITNSVLNAMVDSLGAGYQFMGVATPTNPGSAQTPDHKCFYLATTPGTYTYLGGLVVADGEVAILKYDTSWTKEVSGIATAESVSQLGQDINKEIGYVVKPISEDIEVASSGAGYMRDNGTIGGSAPYYHRVFQVAGSDSIYIKNRFTADNSLHHIVFLDASDNVVSTMFGGATSNIETIISIPSGVVKMNINFHSTAPSVRKIESELAGNVETLLGDMVEAKNEIQELQEITKDEDSALRAKNALNYISRAAGYMRNDGTINTQFAGYYHQDYEVSSGDTIEVVNHFGGSAQNSHIILLNALNEVIGTLYPGNITDIDNTFTVADNVVKIVVNSQGATLPSVYLIGEYIESQDLQNQINTFQNNSWVGKKWVAIGDSLTEINSKTTKNYIAYIQEKTEISVVNMGVGGTGYKNGDTNNNAFYQRSLNVPTDADIVTIFGSLNDMSVPNYDLGNPTDTGTSTICGCINTTIDNILNTFMSANRVPIIGVITPTPWQGRTPGDPANQSSLYCDAIIECCNRKSVPVLDLYRKSNLRPSIERFRELAYSKDGGGGVHPDERGHQIIASVIKEFLAELII